MNFMKLIRRLFCHHGLTKVYELERYVDQYLNVTITSESVCQECGKKKTIKTYYRIGERDSESLEIYEDEYQN